jgi:hypothetical protein
MRRPLLILIVAWLSACAHHPRRVDCDQHLEAINPAHPLVKPEPAKTP